MTELDRQNKLVQQRVKAEKERFQGQNQRLLQVDYNIAVNK